MTDRLKQLANSWYAAYGDKGEAAKYANCGAGDEGNKGFQPGNTCGGDGDGADDPGDEGGGDKAPATEGAGSGMVLNKSDYNDMRQEFFTTPDGDRVNAQAIPEPSELPSDGEVVHYTGDQANLSGMFRVVGRSPASKYGPERLHIEEIMEEGDTDEPRAMRGVDLLNFGGPGRRFMVGASAGELEADAPAAEGGGDKAPAPPGLTEAHAESMNESVAGKTFDGMDDFREWANAEYGSPGEPMSDSAIDFYWDRLPSEAKAPAADAPAAGQGGDEAPEHPSASTPGLLAKGYGVGKDPWQNKWAIDKDGLTDMDAGYFADERQARLAAFASSLSESGDIDPMDSRDLQGFVGYVEDYGSMPYDLHPDDLRDMQERYNERQIGEWETKEVGGREIPDGWAQEFVEGMGGPGELDESTLSSNIDYDKWNAELDSADEGYGWREREDGKYEVYDRQDEDMEPTVYDYGHEAEDAAKESNNELLSEMVSMGGDATHPGSGESYAERYFDYDYWARDAVMGGDITWVDHPNGVGRTWLWGH
jgi:hypothetical protein